MGYSVTMFGMIFCVFTITVMPFVEMCVFINVLYVYAFSRTKMSLIIEC